MAFNFPRPFFIFALFIAVSTLLLADSGNAQTRTAVATKEYKRLVALSIALKKIPVDKLDREPHKSFIKRNRKDIVYSDPAGQWFVDSNRFWDLHKKYKTLSIADEIAWTAASNPLPGECEGFISCYFSVAKMMEIEYLKLYPNGKYSKNAVDAFARDIEMIVADLVPKATYEGPTEASDKAELAEMLNEITTILNKTSQPRTKKVIADIKLVAEAYK